MGQVADAYSKPLDFSGMQSVTPGGGSSSVGSIGRLGGDRQDVTFSDPFNSRYQGIDFTDAFDPRMQGVTTGATPLIRQRGDLAGRVEGNFGRLGGMYGDLRNRFAFADPNSYGAERASVEQAVYDRAMNLLRPDLDRQQSRVDTDLTNRGLAPTSQAARDLQGQFSDRRDRTLNDLALASVMAGTQEHQRLADLTSRNRQQAFGEGMGMFGAGQQTVGALDALNQAGEAERSRQAARELGLRGQQLGGLQARANQQLGLSGQQRADAASRANQQLGLRNQQVQEAVQAEQARRAAEAQRFQQQMALRQQQMQEAMIRRTQPTQDLASLLSSVAPGGSPAVPGKVNYAVQAPDLTGLAGSMYGANQNRRASTTGGLLGGIGSAIGGLAGLFSSREVKEDIRRVGELDNGLEVYAFRYKGSPHTQIGLIAEEVEKVMPDAVGEIAGIKTVRYDLATRPATGAAPW